jgi:iron complex transport system ATP-binding protein
VLLEVKNGCYSYEKGTSVLKKINFSLNKGEILTIMGPNGIGKTTLLKCLLGILKWSSGYSLINGRDSILERKIIGYVPQARNFSFPYTVQDMVVFGRTKNLSIFSSPSTKDYQIADKALEEVGISHLRDKSCNCLSGGQLQLVLIARALAGEPQLLILDEPESHLDFSNQYTILKLIKHLSKDKDIACIMNTHYPNHAIKISDQTLLLNHNKYIVGNTLDVLSRENVLKYFGVDSAIINTNISGRNLSSFILLDQA